MVFLFNCFSPQCLARGSRLGALSAMAKRARTEHFPSISKIQFEGPQSINPLAFKYYQPDEVIMGKKMRRYQEATS